ncbi:MAG TPA: redox-regulated ATPase YchF [Actinomycetota bacterium]|nr:redox-regulated ATPase YchF [Actinomycetota bacterium]
MLQVGIVGLPNAGKSTLFNALAKAHAATAGHPFTTVEPNVGIAMVPDPRLDALAAALKPERVVRAQVRFVDIAGLVRGAHRGEGLGNRFLGLIREVDAVVLVLRAFVSETIPHPDGSVNPVGDLEALVTELGLADLETVTAAASKASRRAAATKQGSERSRAAALEHAEEVLDRGVPVRAELSPDELAVLRDSFLLTAKPFLYVVNVGEEHLGRETELLENVRAVVPSGAELVAVSAKLEEEVEDLPDEEAQALLEEYGIQERGTARIAQSARRLLGLITFYSIESGEVRAWLVSQGTVARDAAGEIHTDMRRGFVKAEVVPAEALASAGSMATARERGLARIEGKDYLVHDGDVLTFRFTA